MYLPPAEPQKAAEHRPPFSTGSEMPLPRALGVCGEEEGELGFDVVRGSLRCVEPGWRPEQRICSRDSTVRPVWSDDNSVQGTPFNIN